MATRADTHGLMSHGLLRLLVAAIVALALVLTLGATPAAAQPPPTTEELLSGMVTEELRASALVPRPPANPSVIERD